MNDRRNAHETEGVIKFDLVRTDGPAPKAPLLKELLGWRTILFRLGLTGQAPLRYGGLAYGNISLRLGEHSFIISGTQTGGREWLEPGDFCTIDDYDLSRNRICSRGGISPSSEALTHAAVYQANPVCRCVIHVHSPEIWQRFRSKQLPATPAHILYGTPAMAAAVGELVRDEPSGTIAMLGHQDGVIGYGTSPETAAMSLLRQMAQSFYSGV